MNARIAHIAATIACLAAPSIVGCCHTVPTETLSTGGTSIARFEAIPEELWDAPSHETVYVWAAAARILETRVIVDYGVAVPATERERGFELARDVVNIMSRDSAACFAATDASGASLETIQNDFKGRSQIYPRPHVSVRQSASNHAPTGGLSRVTMSGSGKEPHHGRPPDA